MLCLNSHYPFKYFVRLNRGRECCFGALANKRGGGVLSRSDVTPDYLKLRCLKSFEKGEFPKKKPFTALVRVHWYWLWLQQSSPSVWKKKNSFKKMHHWVWEIVFSRKAWNVFPPFFKHFWSWKAIFKKSRNFRQWGKIVLKYNSV